MTMNDGRKVDKSLYKDILVDIATYQGMDASGITDTIYGSQLVVIPRD